MGATGPAISVLLLACSWMQYEKHEGISTRGYVGKPRTTECCRRPGLYVGERTTEWAKARAHLVRIHVRFAYTPEDGYRLKRRPTSLWSHYSHVLQTCIRANRRHRLVFSSLNDFVSGLSSDPTRKLWDRREMGRLGCPVGSGRPQSVR